MSNLSHWANIAEILGAVTVVFGVAFGVIQLRHYRRQRADLAAIELVKTFQGRRFTSAIRHVFELPVGCADEDLTRYGPAMEDAAMTVSTTIEAIGVMVHQRMLDIETARSLMGGFVIGAWQRLACWIRQRRDALDRQDFGEWFQWLAERLTELTDRDQRQPAYLRERAWKLPRAR